MSTTFMCEPEGLPPAYDRVEPDCFVWSPAFPHPVTRRPNSQKRVKCQPADAGIPEADMRRIVFENGQRVFGLGL